MNYLGNRLIEEFIPFHKQTDDDEEFILKTIYEDYSNYFKQLNQHSKIDYQNVNHLLHSSSHAVYKNKFENIIDKIEPELLSLNLPFIRLHGDLWSDNILLSDEGGEKTLWYVDWEMADSYVFFHDFFKFMWNELDVNHKDSYLKRYIAGEFDEEFTELFALFDLSFQTELRQSYVCLFFLQFLLNVTDNMELKYKEMEMHSFEEKVFPLLN